MEIVWNEKHGKIFIDLVQELEKKNIRYFVLRNYSMLPNSNFSKDVDIIFEPGYLTQAKEILLKVYKKNNLKYYRYEQFGNINSFWGNSIEDSFSIHIDLIEGYLAKGFEIFTFDELYYHTTRYNNFVVLNPFFSGVMLYIYKQFGYKRPKLKGEYKSEIIDIYNKYPKEFESIIAKLTNQKFAHRACTHIKNADFDSILAETKKLSRLLKIYGFKKNPVKTIVNVSNFNWQRLKKSFIFYKKYSVNYAVLAPDGTGKTTFLVNLQNQLNFYRVCRVEDDCFNVYHFRPNILPNLGEVGEKTGLMKQDKDFTNPHRRKPASKISSFFRISYYTLDYILGWHLCVRNDVRRNRWSVFDRYSYDLIVDPLRTRLNLPDKVRNIFVKLTPKPTIVFYLDADPDIIYKRKQELRPEEIKRQIREYRKISNSDKRIITLDANKSSHEIVNEAVNYLFSQYMIKL